MSSAAVNWILKLTIIRKLARLVGSVIPSSETLARYVHYCRAGVLLVTVSDWWTRRTPLSRHLISNMLVGMGIAAVLAYLHHAHNPWLAEFEGAGMDWMMKLHAGTTVSESATPIAWIEIDEESYGRWNEPLYTPRKNLWNLSSTRPVDAHGLLSSIST